jgi:diguanylate cyclase (GGDEF)-like protein/PAS domain S-box-containing protein
MGIAFSAEMGLAILALMVPVLMLMAHRSGLRRQEAEARLQEMNELLESRVNARTQGLTLANQALERYVQERNLSHARMRKLSLALEQADDVVVITDRNGLIEYVNAAFERITGYSREEALGNKPSLLKSGRLSPAFYENLWQTICSGGIFREVIINRRKSGELYYEEKTITPLKTPEGLISHFVSTGKDITDHTRLQERLYYLSNHDALTQLPNRTLFMDRLSYAVSSARCQKAQIAVLFLDLDNFKNIVDTLGHAAGDVLLETMSRRLRNCMRESDTLARLGGDEFGLVIAGASNVATLAANLAQRMLEQISLPCDVNEREIMLTASIGITLYPGDGTDMTALTRNADAAMYRAKELGRDNYQFFTAEITIRAMKRLEMENHLRHALERNEFSLHYQPKIHLDDGKVYGLEALLRWHNPVLGVVEPDQFIPVLESNGLIVPVGNWVLNEACLFLCRLQDHGHDLSMAVNLSARQIRAAGLAERIEHLLDSLKLAPASLELEITESMLIENMEPAVALLGRVKARGVRVSVDDFGTGYSWLGYLKRLPIDTLKIDRSFVCDLPNDAENGAIASAIVGLAHSLDLDVVAEGIETPEQAEFMKTLGCELGQGYLFSRPLADRNLLDWLEQQRFTRRLFLVTEQRRFAYRTRPCP